MLVSTGDHDDRVVPLHSYKYVAELQYKAGNGKVAGQNPILLQVKKDRGHAGVNGLTSIIEEDALKYAFIAKVTNSPWIN